MLIENGVVKERWVEYFMELLNKKETQAVTYDDTHTVEIPEPAYEEIKQMIRESRNPKAPGKNSIIVKLIKYGGSYGN